MSKQTTLASGEITRSPHHTIIVELLEPDGVPAVVRIGWPPKPTVVDPRQFPDTAAVIVRMFSEAATALAAIKVNRRL